MSTTTFLRSSAIGAICIAGLSIAVSANAQSSRYGGSVYDYESGSNCQVQPCATAPAATKSSRYGGEYVETVPAAPVYVDCQTTFGPQCGAPVVHQPTTVYTQPQPMYTQQAQSYQSAPANCPAGSTMQPDGSCMQGSSYSTYSEPATTYSDSYSSSSTYSSGQMADCPAGTTAQPDGTCMQGSGYSSYSSESVTLPGGYDSMSTSTYSSGPSYSAGPPANCPAGTTAQSDGTCMQGGSSSYNSYSDSSVEIYSGDAQPSQATTYGYTSDGAYTAKDYMPIRK